MFRSGLKTGVENDIFWSEIRSGFGELGGAPPPSYCFVSVVGKEYHLGR